MTAPIFMASPPEVWSILLSSGPGPGALQAAAASWQALSTEYAEVSAELTTLLGDVEAAAWEGPSAAAYGAAHLPFLAWLTEASGKSAVAAAQHEVAASSYMAALAAMPTMAELTANHVVHGVLLATNFFGINTIPIAVNEADYLRMWAQAAATMTAYHAVNTAAVTATPQTAPAPMVMKTDMDGMGGGSSGPTPADNGGKPLMWWMMKDHVPQSLDDWYHALFPPQFNPLDPNSFQGMYPNLETFLPRIGTMFSAYSGNPAQLAQAMFFLGAQFIVHRTLFLTWIVLNNPAMLGTFITANPIYSAGLAAIPMVAAPVAAAPAAGLTGLAGLGAITPAPPAVAAPPMAPMPPGPAPSPPPAMPSAPATAVTPPPSAPVLPSTAPPPPGPPPAPVLGPESTMAAHNAIYPYLATAVSARSRDAQRRRKPAPGAEEAEQEAPAATVQHAEERQRRRRRKKMTMVGRGYEYMDLEPGPDEGPPGGPRVVLSGVGAQNVGFAGTAAAAAAPAGLTAVVDDTATGPHRMPMMPGSWQGATPPE